MYDIELVIKIPKDKFKLLQEYQKQEKEDCLRALSYDERIIANGIPLSKGHGKLIDVGQCDRRLFYQQCGGADSLITAKAAFDMLMSLPAIIEADIEESEVKNADSD